MDVRGAQAQIRRFDCDDVRFLHCVENAMRANYEHERQQHPEMPPWSLDFLYKIEPPVLMPGYEYWVWIVDTDG